MKRKFFISSILLIGASILLTCSTDSLGQKSETKPLILNKGPQLFIDEYLIAEQSFLLRTVNNPEKFDKPVIYGGENDKNFIPYLSVLRDEKTGRFRMWYNAPAHLVNMPAESVGRGSSHIAYTESDDGINWDRPPKILKNPHDTQFGVTVMDRGSDYKNLDKRYVFATFGSRAGRGGFMISTSPDGLNWTVLPDQPAFEHDHDITSLHWDPIRKQYIALASERIRGFANTPYDMILRIPHQTTSEDLINWEPLWHIITPKIGVPIEKGETQFYLMSGVITRGDLLIGLVKVLRDDLNATYGKDGKEMGELELKAGGIGYTVLAWSRDGRTWQRDYEPFIPRNYVPGTFDHAMAWGDEQIIVGDKTFIYYGGYERGHKINRYEERHIGMAIMPRDRYVSRDADYNPGTLITKPLIINFEHLTVNANVRGGGRVRLLSADGNPLDGFGWVEFKGDLIEHEVKWSKNLNSISGKTVCLEFQLKDAQLFGFNLH